MEYTGIWVKQDEWPTLILYTEAAWYESNKFL